MRNALLVPALLVLAACHQSTIQGDYHDISEGCRGMAETRVSAASTSVSKSARDAELVAAFSDCMAKKGWAVATPKRAKAPAGSSAKPAPAPAPAAAPAPAPATTPYTPSGAAGTQYQSTQPVTLPAGQQPSYSIYQPAYPAPEPGTTPPAVTNDSAVPPRY